MAMVVAAMLAIYTFVLVDSRAHAHRLISDVTWPAYRADCGYDAFTANPRHSFRTFEMLYFGRNVQWDGYVIRVNLNDDD